MISPATKENAANLKRDVKLTADSVEQDIENLPHSSIVQTASEFAHEAGRKTRDYIEAANDRISDITDKVNTEIHHNPVRSSMMALGMGFFLGLLLRR